VGIFQYESAGMQKYMKELSQRFSRFNTMNALYRPGPIAYIEFCKGKNGKRRLFMTLRPVKY
jgi:DNA polymerase-3 subunit alpha